MKVPAKENKPLFITLPFAIYFDKDLTSSEKLILGEIFNLLSAGSKDCWASNGHFSEMFGFSKQFSSKSLKHIEKLGWLTSKLIVSKERGNMRHLIPLLPLSTIIDSLSTSRGGGYQPGLTPYQPTSRDKNNIYNNTKNKEPLLRKNPIFNDPDYQKREKLDKKTDSGYRLYVALTSTLESRYPAWKFAATWAEIKKATS